MERGEAAIIMRQRISARRTGMAVLLGGLVLAIAGCGGGSSDAGAPATVTVTTAETTSTDKATTVEASSNSGRVPVTEEACAALRHAYSHLQDVQVLGYWDYVNDAAAVDNFADHVQLPEAVADSVKTFRSVVDRVATAFKDAGVAPNKKPLPDQQDKISKQLPSSASADDTRAFQTVATWTENDCS
jgi:hypothetical protein